FGYVLLRLKNDFPYSCDSTSCSVALSIAISPVFPASPGEMPSEISQAENIAMVRSQATAFHREMVAEKQPDTGQSVGCRQRLTSAC
ncbi:hypothetical protein PE067_13575, partial [Paracoccus sp. DMF-8]|uniref:hypothetical protein n=1 Tax=Paracoccus sp. DMF-8 TaxID=3019445 RepID=UPI0023E8D495